LHAGAAPRVVLQIATAPVQYGRWALAARRNSSHFTATGDWHDAVLLNGMSSTDWTETVRYLQGALWIANIVIYGYALWLWARPEANEAASTVGLRDRRVEPVSSCRLRDVAAATDLVRR
jgi:hypothetical protein